MIRPEVNGLLAHDFQPETLEKDILQVLKQRQDSLAQARDTHWKKTSRVQVVEAQSNQVRIEMQEKNRELEGIASVI